MNKLQRGLAVSIVGMVMIILILTFFPKSTLADENIYGLKIENINKNGADFNWSTSIETMGSIDYAYTKLPELYNPQSPGISQDILMTVIPMQTKTQDRYRKEHHIKVDNLDIDYCPFVEYTIKSQAYNGEIYTISGEFVLVDTQKIHWWQTWQFAIITFISGIILGQIAWPTATSRIWKYMRSKMMAKREQVT